MKRVVGKKSDEVFEPPNTAGAFISTAWCPLICVDMPLSPGGPLITPPPGPTLRVGADFLCSVPARVKGTLCSLANRPGHKATADAEARQAQVWCDVRFSEFPPAGPGRLYFYCFSPLAAAHLSSLSEDIRAMRPGSRFLGRCSYTEMIHIVATGLWPDATQALHSRAGQWPLSEWHSLSRLSGKRDSAGPVVILAV